MEKEPTIGRRMGFMETLQDTLAIYRSVRDSGDPKWTFEDKISFGDAIEHIKLSDIYFMGEEFTEMLTDYTGQFQDVVGEDIRVSEFTRPPSNRCYLRLDAYKRHADMQNIAALTEWYEDGTTAVTLVAPYSKPQRLGGFNAKRGVGFFDDDVDDWPEDKWQAYTQCILLTAGAFELINTPRFVKSEPAGTRAQRKLFKREQEIPMEVWHQISWNINEPVEVHKGDRGGWNMPLHYNRGYYRRAKPHWDDVVEKDGQFYKWVEGYWAGHPAYGIKKGYHAPKLGRAA